MDPTTRIDLSSNVAQKRSERKYTRFCEKRHKFWATYLPSVTLPWSAPQPTIRLINRRLENEERYRHQYPRRCIRCNLRENTQWNILSSTEHFPQVPSRDQIIYEYGLQVQKLYARKRIRVYNFSPTYFKEGLWKQRNTGLTKMTPKVRYLYLIFVHKNYLKSKPLL